MPSLVGSTPALFRHLPIPATMRDTFRGKVPDGLLYHTGHDMWVRADGDEVVIGATSFGIHLAGEIIAFTAKPRGAEIERGRGLGTVECAKTVIAVHSPVAFTLTEGNEALEARPALLNRDPYAAWMTRGKARHWSADRALLVDAAAYGEHIRHIEPEAVIE
jgi:glycine cleavage system H protein